MIHIYLKHCAHFAIILEENSSWSSQHQWSILLLHFICSFLFTTKFSNTTLPKRTCLCPSSCVPHSYLRVTIEHVRASAFESRSEHKLERENILIFFFFCQCPDSLTVEPVQSLFQYMFLNYYLWGQTLILYHWNK